MRGEGRNGTHARRAPEPSKGREGTGCTESRTLPGEGFTEVFIFEMNLQVGGLPCRNRRHSRQR